MEVLTGRIALDAFKMKINRFKTKEVLLGEFTLWKL